VCTGEFKQSPTPHRGNLWAGSVLLPMLLDYRDVIGTSLITYIVQHHSSGYPMRVVDVYQYDRVELQLHGWPCHGP